MNKNIKYSQNFLTSEKVLNQIIKQLNLKETDTVYEIGTGKGHLTTKLAKISKQVTSIELDSHLFNLSSEKLKLNTRVTLIHQDILQFQFPNKQRYKIVGSIPYHLSTQIIKKVVFESHASDIYLIVEEGFYKRTLDIHRTLGLLLHTQVSIQQLLKLPAECFHPKPKVNSVLIKLTRHTTEAFAHFFEASMGDQGKLELLANFFPTAFGIFSSMIDSIRPDNHVRVLSRER